MRLITRCGSAAADGLNEALLAKAAAAAKVLRTNRVRTDTTVVPANVAYSTRFGAVGQSGAPDRVGCQADSGRRPCAPGCVTVPARPLSVLMRSLPSCGSGSVMGCGEATAAVLATGGELAGLARAAACDAQRLLINVKQAIRRGRVKAAQLAARGQRDAAACRPRGRFVRAVNELQKLVALTQ